MKIGGHIAKTRSPSMMMLDDTLTLDDTSGLSPSRFHLLGIIVFVFWSMINSRVREHNLSLQFSSTWIILFFANFIPFYLNRTDIRRRIIFHSNLRCMSLSYATIEEIYVSSRRIHTMIRLLWQKKYCSSSMLDILPCRRDHLWQQNAFEAKYSSVESEKVTLSLFSYV